jgi:hypothetical protein
VKIFARHELVRPILLSVEPALLLEGSWPVESTGPSRWSLDEWIDLRHAWIDDEASRLAAVASRGSSGEITLAYLNVLPLRYYLVKLLRVVAAFKRPELLDAVSVELHLTRGRDEDYADIIADLTERSACKLQIHWHEGVPARKNFPPRNAFWRRLAARLHQWQQRRVLQHRDGDCRNVVLCGNPRILNPVCAELVRRGTRTWWLYDRFAVGTWRQWRHANVGQLICNSSAGRSHLFSDGYSHARLASRHVDLTRPVDRWLNRLAGEVGAAQSRLLEQINLHFEQIQPEALVVDEDATPLSRAAVAITRRLGIESTVVQHGVPCVQFGFAPLAANRICAWDVGSERQLRRWGVPSDRIVVTGSSQEYDLRPRNRALQQPSSVVAPSLLLIATVPPNNDRPEPATFHLTRQTYAQMLRMACAAAAQIPGARLTVKLHPRAPDPAEIQHAAAEFPKLAWRIARNESLAELLSESDCVLSCVSSAGIEAASLGFPVIQLLPAGCGDILPAEDYGLIGSVRTLEELSPLLKQALIQPLDKTTAPRPAGDVARIVNMILSHDSAATAFDSSSLASDASRPLAKISVD